MAWLGKTVVSSHMAMARWITHEEIKAFGGWGKDVADQHYMQGAQVPVVLACAGFYKFDRNTITSMYFAGASPGCCRFCACLSQVCRGRRALSLGDRQQPAQGPVGAFVAAPLAAVAVANAADAACWAAQGSDPVCAACHHIARAPRRGGSQGRSGVFAHARRGLAPVSAGAQPQPLFPDAATESRQQSVPRGKAERGRTARAGVHGVAVQDSPCNRAQPRAALLTLCRSTTSFGPSRSSSSWGT